MDLSKLEMALRIGSKIVFYSYRSVRVTGAICDFLLDSEQFQFALHDLKKHAGVRVENGNHECFVITHANGTSIALGFSDLRVEIGTGVEAS